MVSGILSRMISWFFKFGFWLRRPEVLIFAPAAALCSFWFLGEESLILLALLLPTAADCCRRDPAAPTHPRGSSFARCVRGIVFAQPNHWQP